MRRELLTATALVTTATFLVPSLAIAQQTEVPFEWSGPYLGASLGVVQSHSNLDLSYDYSPYDSLPASLGLSDQGPLITVTGGYNIQTGHVVFGIETDASLLDLDETAVEDGASVDAHLTSLMTLRGRLGFASGRWLGYGTFGVAGGNAKYSAEVVDNGKSGPIEDVIADHGSGFVTGLVGGIGAEYAVNDNVSVKTEALVYSLDPLSGHGGDTGKGPYSSTYQPDGVLFRAGVNAHF